MRRLIRTIAVLGALAGGAILLWRRNPRAGARLMNERIDPFLLRRNVSDGSHSQIATLEHVGRRSGRRRLTLVHPVATDSGFRVVVPLGSSSEWARNVLSAGHCRMFLRGIVYDLDEPVLRSPADVPGVPRARRLAERALGFSYLELHRFAERPGTLEVPAAAMQAGTLQEQAAEAIHGSATAEQQAASASAPPEATSGTAEAAEASDVPEQEATPISW